MAKRNNLQEFLDELDRAEAMLPEPIDLEEPVKELDKKVTWLLNLLGRGGNANRDIKVDGANVLRPFTDINLISGTDISITASANQQTKYTDITITATGGGPTIETPTGLVNASNTTFTPTAQPQYVVSDGITYFDGAGYTWSSPNIIMDVPPSKYIRDAI